MQTDECIHLLTPDTCATCRGTPDSRPPIKRAFRYGPCGACDTAIWAGDEIIRLDGTWCHVHHLDE